MSGAEDSSNLVELYQKQSALQRILNERHKVIFSDYSNGRDYVALTEKEQEPEKLCLNFFKTKEAMINFLRTKQVFAYDCRNSGEMILMF